MFTSSKVPFSFLLLYRFALGLGGPFSTLSDIFLHIWKFIFPSMTSHAISLVCASALTTARNREPIRVPDPVQCPSVGVINPEAQNSKGSGPGQPGAPSPGQARVAGGREGLSTLHLTGDHHLTGEKLPGAETSVCRYPSSCG